MKTLQIISIYCMLFPISMRGISQEKGSWKMQPVAIQTRWAKEISPTHNLDAYPRPQLARKNWINLNGLWDYAITDQNTSSPNAYDGKILVPYPLESALSGVKKSLNARQLLWYKRNLDKPALNPEERMVLNFGAVDYQATIYVNGKEIGHHTGGYTAFSFDITDALISGPNELLVKVYDPTDQGVGPHGKQVSNPKDIYYTPTSGIWQTVWAEIVHEDHIEGLVMTPDIDKELLNLVVTTHAAQPGVTVEAEVASPASGSPNGRVRIASSTTPLYNGNKGAGITLKIPSARWWSPGTPFLYDLVVRLRKNGKVVDEVKSYFGMRKICIAKDSRGIDRIFLNNQPYYNLGTLDQGFWPEGLYTAPTDDALAFDIKAIKAMGFNTIRKHIKVEPARWYYYTDKIGMLVWQDMVNPNQSLPKGAKESFEAQAKETIAQLYNFPSITTWVLFNEKWGQYDQERLTQWIKSTDPSRIVNGHSGEFLYVNGQLRSPSPNAYIDADITDVHSYPNPMLSIRQEGKAMVCGEFGGIGVFIPDHQWVTNSAWGYIQEKVATLKYKYSIMVKYLQMYKNQGLSGSIYTQPFDVEGEQNGLMTYDREVVKIPFEDLRRINSSLTQDMGVIPKVFAQTADTRDPNQIYNEMLSQYVDGNRDKLFLRKMLLLASQVGDKQGQLLASNAYLSALTLPLTNEEALLVLDFTKNTNDPGYQFIQKNEKMFKKAVGERNLKVAIMSMVMKGEIEPIINSTKDINWDEIKSKVKPFGEAGEEMFYRARAITLYNRKDWLNYGPAVMEYLKKYGQNLNKEEKEVLENAVENNK